MAQDPQSGQTQVIKDMDSTARIGPYVDPNLTERNVDESANKAATYPATQANNKLGSVRPVYAPDQAEEVDNAATNPGLPVLPQSPNSWKHGRDPYKIDGAVGQDFLKNGGSS